MIVLGAGGTAVLLSLTGLVFWTYRGSQARTFRWHWRNIHLRQIAAVACLFYLAMAASYAVLQQGWLIFYLIVALKVGTWWLRITVYRRV